MAGQTFTLQNTSAASPANLSSSTVAFRVYVPWSRGQYTNIVTLRQAEQVQIGGVNISTFWESFGAPHWDGSIHHTYAVFRYNLLAGTASPTQADIRGTIVRSNPGAAPTPTFPAWTADIDLGFVYDEDDPVDPNSYSIQVCDVARAGTNSASATTTDTGGSRYIKFQAWTGNGDHGRPTGRRVAGDGDPATFFAGNLHIYAFMEWRSGDTHALVEVLWANDAAYPSGTNGDGTGLNPVTAPDAIAYPLDPSTSTLCTVTDQDFRRWIDAAVLTITGSVPLYSAPIGVSDYGTGAGPLGTIAPGGGGNDWAIPITGLGYGGGWARSWIVSSTSDAHAQHIATHFGTLYGYPTISTAQGHRRQRNLQGISMQMAGYRWPVTAELTQAVANTYFATGPAMKTAFYAAPQANPWYFPPGYAFGPSGGPHFNLGECREPFGYFVYAGSPWHLNKAYLQTMQDFAIVMQHKEIEALADMSTVWDDYSLDLWAFTSHWDGTNQFFSGRVQFGLRHSRVNSASAYATWNGSTAVLSNTGDPRMAQIPATNGSEPTLRNAEHMGTSPLFWTGLITGSQLCRHLLAEYGWISARQLNSRKFNNQGYDSNPANLRMEGRRYQCVLDAREIAITDVEQRDEMLLIVQRRGAALDGSRDEIGSWGGYRGGASVLGMDPSNNTPTAYRFGLLAPNVTEDISERQWICWHAPILILELMRAAFAAPEEDQEDFAEGCATVAQHLSRIVTESHVVMNPAPNLPAPYTSLSVTARRPMDQWFAARAAELAGTGGAAVHHIMGMSSRGVDVTRSHETDVFFGDYVVTLNPSNDAKSLQQMPAFVMALAFAENIAIPGLQERALEAIARFSELFPQWAGGDYFGGQFGVCCGYILGASGPSGPSVSGAATGTLPVEGSTVPTPGDFGTLPTPGPTLCTAGGFASLSNAWALPVPGPTLCTAGGFATFLAGSGGGGVLDPVEPGNPHQPVDPTIRIEIEMPMDEPEDVRCYVQAPDGEVGTAVLTGPGLVPVYHGMRRSEQVSMAPFQRRLYVGNGKVRPVEYSEFGAAFAGVTPPAGEPKIRIERKSLGIRDHAGTSFTGDGALFALTNVAGYRLSEQDVGKLVVIPSSSLFQAASNDGPDYIGVIETVSDEATAGVNPAFNTNQDFTGATIWIFPEKTTATPGAMVGTEWLEALALAPAATTPYSARRPFADGTPAAGTANTLCLGFKGQHAIECTGVDMQLDRDMVVDFKCYLRAESVETGGGGRIIVWTRRSADNKSAFELSVVENGKLEFRFWDIDIADWRSARSIGVCLTIHEWYYLRFTYRFKVDGGWRQNDRHLLRNSGSLAMDGNWRDGLSCWALEAKNPADRFLVVAGLKNAFGQAVAANALPRNYSREIGNTGYLASDPWIGPRKGDQGFDQGSLATEQPSMQKAARSGTFTWTMDAATDMFLARWMSANRDEPYTGDGKVQLSQAAANYYTTSSPGTPGTGTTAAHGRALLVYVYGPDAGPEFATPRILALLSVGSSDIANASALGANTSTFFLSNSVALGADGLAENDAGGDISSNGDYIIAFAFPNGSNHASAATGNRDPIPTLLVQGENPLGVNDAPMTLGAAVYIGGVDRSKELDSSIQNWSGQIDDVGFSILALSDVATMYSADMMPPDVDFHGPVDTRIGSLPALNFAAADTVEAGASGTRGSASWSSRCDVIRGAVLVPATAGSPQIQGSILGAGRGQKDHGLHQVVVTLFDPEREHESPPSPIGKVTIKNEPDEFEPDAERAIVVEQLPSPAEIGRELWRLVYVTLPNGSVFKLGAEIRDRETSEARIVIDTITFATRPDIDFGYQNPPVCSALEASEGRLFFGGVNEPGAQGVVQWSDYLTPWQVPGSNRDELEAESDAVVGLKYLNGTIYAFTRSALFAGQEAGDLIVFARIQSNTGALSHEAIVELEDRALFTSDKGVFAWDGGSRVEYVSRDIAPSYRLLDAQKLRRGQAAYSRRRNLFMLNAAEGVSPYQTALFTTYFGHGVPVWSREIHAQGISALASATDPRTKDRVVYFGTPSCFLGELDAGARPRGQYEHELYGTLDATVLGGGGSYFVTLDNPDFDDALDGVSGVPFIITRTDDEGHTALIDRGFVWRFDGTRAHTMQRVASDVQYGDQFVLGGWATIWTSGDFDLRAHTKRKFLQHVDLNFDAEVGGKIELTTYANRESAAVATRSCPMDRGFDLPHVATRGSYLRFRLMKLGRTACRINSMAIRVAIQTQRGGGDGSAT